MSIEYAAGVAAGVITALIVIVVINKVSKNSLKGHYDERQELVRGRGYKYAAFTFMGLILVYLFANELGVFDLLPVTHGCAAGFIFFAGVMVYALYCIHNDAYLGIGSSARSYKIVMWIVIACNTFTLITKIIDGEFMENGKIPFTSGTYLMFVIVFVCIMIALQVRGSRLRKEEADEES